jgi:mannitol-1-phosphate/altronate dehydrogenase
MPPAAPRQAAGLAPLTLVSCDNLPDNGRVLRAGVAAFLNHQGPQHRLDPRAVAIGDGGDDAVDHGVGTAPVALEPSIYHHLARAVVARQAAGLAPLTLVSCDNLPDNGRGTMRSTMVLGQRQSRSNQPRAAVSP